MMIELEKDVVSPFSYLRADNGSTSFARCNSMERENLSYNDMEYIFSRTVHVFLYFAPVDGTFFTLGLMYNALPYIRKRFLQLGSPWNQLRRAGLALVTRIVVAMLYCISYLARTVKSTIRKFLTIGFRG